jgi:hypothetical protein
MAYYQTPNIDDTKGFYEYFGFVNTAAGGLFFPAMIFVIWIVIFLAVKSYSTPKAFTFASFMCSILSILLAVMDYISPKIMYVFFIFLVIGLVWLKLDTES